MNNRISNLSQQLIDSRDRILDVFRQQISLLILDVHNKNESNSPKLKQLQDIDDRLQQIRGLISILEKGTDKVKIELGLRDRIVSFKEEVDAILHDTKL